MQKNHALKKKSVRKIYILTIICEFYPLYYFFIYIFWVSARGLCIEGEIKIFSVLAYFEACTHVWAMQKEDVTYFLLGGCTDTNLRSVDNQTKIYGKLCS